jgi:hypothetical protein
MPAAIFLTPGAEPSGRFGLRHRHSRAATQRLHEHVRPKEARLILIAPTESHRLDPASTPKIERVSFF